MNILSPKNIPFLKISHPPSPYCLRNARIEANKRTKNKTFARWDVEKVERRWLLNNFSSFETVYITEGNFKEKARQERSNLIHYSLPAITKLGTEKEQVKNSAGAPQFSYGGYYEQDKLFLIDDIFDWSHHRISWSEIRTAKSLVDSLKDKSPKNANN